MMYIAKHFVTFRTRFDVSAFRMEARMEARMEEGHSAVSKRVKKVTFYGRK